MEIKKKKFTYKGMSIEELKKLNVREFAKYLKSRQKRSVLRQFQKVEDFINRAKEKQNKDKRIRTHQRDLVIVPQMIGMKISIYNGNKFVPVNIVEEMLGHKLGELAPTRGRVKHGSAGVGGTKGTRAQAKK